MEAHILELTAQTAVRGSGESAFHGAGAQELFRLLITGLEKTLMLGGIEGRRRRGRQRMRWLDGITDSMDIKTF